MNNIDKLKFINPSEIIEKNPFLKRLLRCANNKNRSTESNDTNSIKELDERLNLFK